MQKKLTIGLDEEVHKSVEIFAGEQSPGRFIEELIRSYVISQNKDDTQKKKIKDEEDEFWAYL